MSDKPIYVTRPALPPLQDLLPQLESIWQSAQVTNGGDQIRAFEAGLGEFLGVAHITPCCNGTIALMCALRACRLPPGAEVITTPYSFVATTSAILWAGLTPVFADTSPDDFNLDPASIAAAISPRTAAIMPVHCYGRPCDIDAIDDIARRHDLKVIYDAAHAFGADRLSGGLLEGGDFSVISFHGTKVFNTFEGGCVIAGSAEDKLSVDRLINFGFVNETTIEGVGINGKMSEFNAALGRAQLPLIRRQIERCRELHHQYHKKLAGIAGLTLPSDAGYHSNYSYYPLRVNDTFPGGRDGLYDALREQNIFTRRYFYPLIPDFPDYAAHRRDAALPNATRLSREVLCLPIYADLSDDDLARVCRAIQSAAGTV